VAYRAEIEIAVKGARDLTQFQGKLKATALEVEQLNKFLKAFSQDAEGIPRSIANLNRQLNEASNAFNDVALGTKEARTAAVDYLGATRNLNAGLKERAALLAEVAENERRVKLASAGIRERTQYSGPIGPGEASPINALVGQSSEVAGRVQRIKDIKEDQRTLDKALLDLERKSAAELSKKVQLQESLVKGTREVLELAAEAQRKQQFRAGKSGSTQLGPLAGPGAFGFPVALPLTAAEQKGLEIAAKKQQILQRTVKTRQDLVGLAANLQRLETRTTVAIADAKREQQQLNDQKQRALQLSERQLQISKQGARLAGRFNDIKGAKNIPGSPKFIEAQARRRKEALGSGIIGGAFPLLFGQGVGAAVGGGAGGAAGGLVGGQFGFGLSLVGTALGTAVDTFIGNISKVADSLGDPTKALEAFEEAGFKVDDSIKLQVKSLLEAGKAYEAQSLVFKQISDTLGPNAVGQLNAYQQESEKLNDKYRELSAAITRELLPVLVGLLRVVNQFTSIPFFKELVAASYAVNPLTLGLVAGGAALKQSGEIAGRNAGSDVALSPELEAAAAERAKVNKELENSLRMQVELSNRKLALSKINKKTDLDAWLVAQQQIIAQEYKIRNEEIYLRYKKEGLSQEIRSLLVQESMNQRSTARQKLLQDYRNTLDQINSAQERADKKALDNAKRIARAKNAAAISDARSLKALFASSVALTKERDGELAAVRQRQKQLEQEATLELEILATKYRESAANAQSKEEADSLYNAYLKQYQTLVNTYELEKLRTGQLEQQLSIYGAIASLSAAAGFQVSGDPRGAFVPKGAAGILKGVAGPSFEAGAELNAIVKQEVALARVLEKYQEIGQAAQLTSELVTTGFQDMLTGTKSAEEVFANFLRNLAEMLIKTAQQMIATYIAIGIARAFGLGQSPSIGTRASDFNLPGFGNLGSDAGSGISGFLAGGSGILGKANGGPVSAGTPYMVGERGPELFVPNNSGNIVPNHALGGDVNVVVNVTETQTDTRGNGARANQVGNALAAAVQAEIIKQKRPGGLLAN